MQPSDGSTQFYLAKDSMECKSKCTTEGDLTLTKKLVILERGIFMNVPLPLTSHRISMLSLWRIREGR